MASSLPPPDDISQPISGGPSYGTSPELDALHTGIASVLANVQPTIDGSIGDAITAADNDISQSVTSNDLAIRQLLGQLSIDADAVGNPVTRAIDKLYSDVLVSIAGGLHEVEFNGIRVPFDVKLQQAMLDDATGEPVINAIMGIDPGVLPNVPADQLASTTVSGDAQSPPPVSRVTLAPLGSPSLAGVALSPIPGPSTTSTTDSGTANTLPATGRAIPTDITSPPVFVGDGETGPAIPPTPGITVPPVIGPPGPAPEPEPAPVVPPVPPSPPPPPCHDDMDCRPASEAIICFPKKTGETGTTEPPPPVPPAPPGEGGTGETTGETPPTGEEEIPPGEPPSLPPPSGEVTPVATLALPYHDPIICQNIPLYVEYFRSLGIWLTTDRAMVKAQVEDQISRIETATFIAAGSGIINGLLTAVTKLSIEPGPVLEAIIKWFEIRLARRLSATQQVERDTITSVHGYAVQDGTPELLGMYFFRAQLMEVNTDLYNADANYVGITHAPAIYAKLLQIVDYCIQWVSPTTAPDPEYIKLLWLQGRINDGHASCLVRLHGMQWPVTRMAWYQQRIRPGVRETIDLFNRGSIDEVELANRLSELGVGETREQDLLYSLSRFIPPYTDLISFMVRDAFDENVARDYQLDKGFTDKFTGQTEAWARAQGITPDVFKYNWRSHWKIPSNTQLYEISARYRPDRPEVIAWDQQNAIATANGNPLDPSTRPPVFDAAALQKALEVNDQAPQFVPFLVGINQHPVNPSDAARAYQTGAFNEEQFYHTLRDNQYSDQSARLRVSIERATKDRRLASATGQGTPRQIAGWYKDGVIDRNTADRFLSPLIIDANQRRDTLDKVDLEVKAATMRRWVARARRAYFTGVWNADEAKGNLLTIGIDSDRVPAILEQWTADLRGRYREPSARQIIQWMQINVITPQDAYQRLINMGWLELDANRIVAQGIVAYSEKIVGQLDKMNSQWRTKIRDARAAKRERDQELKDYQKQIQDTQKKLEQEQKRVEDELRKRGLIP